ncbi:hypothetical protein IFM89_002122 [Coptis chinensis]|uniref:Uncharacterized protein n=1 Tax=Coptis chinensis TaxID=261450 RepID=A0A835H3P4_9MAGN|nr:hypothetical protein IFM89_002122 [Coptis chinensis]
MIRFLDVQYFVDTSKAMKEKGVEPKRLQLLRDITGAFRPGILTTLMGVSGAGKIALMDVLSRRKTGGTIEGEIRIGGYPKDFVKAVLQTIELDGIKDSMVGVPGVTGISTEQRKKLIIAVELVANPSIIFMDEPTLGLDARSAAVVMRAVKNVVSTKRTIVCTIHQPSIDIFDAFDETSKGAICICPKENMPMVEGLARHPLDLRDLFKEVTSCGPRPRVRTNNDLTKPTTNGPFFREESEAFR